MKIRELRMVTHTWLAIPVGLVILLGLELANIIKRERKVKA